MRRATSGAAVQTSVESSGGPAVIVSEPSGANASAETTPPGSPSTRSAVEPQLALAAAIDGPGAPRPGLVERDALDVAVVGRQELGLEAVPEHGEPRELAAGVAGAEHGAVGQQAGRVVGDLAVVRA